MTTPSLTQAIQALKLGVDFADTNGTLAGIRWDNPPKNFVPPTQAQVDAQIAILAIPQSITYTQAMKQLNALGKLSAAQSAASQAGGLTAALWYAPTWDYSDFLVDPFKSMASSLSIDPAAFFTAAAQLS